MSILHCWSKDFPIKKSAINYVNINNSNNHILDIIQLKKKQFKNVR